MDIGPSYYPERALMYSRERRGGFWQALGACVKASNLPPHACIYDAISEKRGTILTLMWRLFFRQN